MSLVLYVIIVYIFFYLYFQYVSPYIVRYQFTDDCIIKYILHIIPIFKLRYSTVLEIRKITYFELVNPLTYNFLPTLSLGYRIWGGEIVLIRTAQGFFRNIIITPDNAEEFIHTVKSHIELIKDRPLTD